MKNIEKKRGSGFVNLGVVFVILVLITLVLIGPKIYTKSLNKSDLKIVTTNNMNTLTPNPTLEVKPSIFETTKPTPVPTLTPTSVPTPTKTPTPVPKPPTPVPVSGPPGAGFSRITVATEKGNFPASVLTIDLNSARVITDTGNDSDCVTNCTVLPLKDYVTRNGGFAGINGSYFCPATYPDCTSKTNSYDFPVWNTKLSKWINGGNLFWNSRSIFYVDGSGAHYLQDAKSFGGGLTAGIVNYPGLVNGGQVQIDEAQSGLSANQKAVGTKVGIGMVDSKKVIVAVAGGVNMHQFAYVFKALGAKGALNLDTGGSTALFYNGSYLFGPGRNLPNAVVFAR